MNGGQFYSWTQILTCEAVSIAAGHGVTLPGCRVGAHQLGEHNVASASVKIRELTW